MNQAFDCGIIGEFYESSEIGHSRDDALDDLANLVVFGEFFNRYFHRRFFRNYELRAARIGVDYFYFKLHSHKFLKFGRYLVSVFRRNSRIMFSRKLGNGQKGRYSAQIGDKAAAVGALYLYFDDFFAFLKFLDFRPGFLPAGFGKRQLNHSFFVVHFDYFGMNRVADFELLYRPLGVLDLFTVDQSRAVAAQVDNHRICAFLEHYPLNEVAGFKHREQFGLVFHELLEKLLDVICRHWSLRLS